VVADTLSAPEISAPMFDVHPPHESIHTWRSFFIHIATLVKHVQFGNSFGRYAHEFPELPHSITWDLVDKWRPSSAATDPVAMAGVHQRTEDRIDAAIAEMTREIESSRPQASHP